MQSGYPVRDGSMDGFQSPYGFAPQSNGGIPGQTQQYSMPNTFIPPPPAPLNQQPASGDGINAFFSSAPTQFIGQQFVQGGQQYVQRFQERIGVLSGSVLNYHFAVNNEYVRKKIMILLMPYLKKWNFSRLPEQIPGGPRFRAPRADVNCPDLYIPLMAFCSYCVFSGVRDLFLTRFTTDMMYTKVYRGLLGWLLHICVFKTLAYMMSMSSTLTFVESSCYTGYMFVLLTFRLLGSLMRSEALRSFHGVLRTVAVVGYVSFGFWLYSSLCMAIFLVRSVKRLLHHEARHYGGDASRHNYLLLCLAAFQFVLFYFMG